MWITKAILTGFVGISAMGGFIGIPHGPRPHPPIVGQNAPIPPPSAVSPSVMAGRATIRPPKNQQKSSELAWLIQAQPPGSRVNIAVISPPPLAEIVASLPTGTTFTGNIIALPNGTAVAIVKVKPYKQYEAELLASTYTRDQLANALAELPAGATVSIKEPSGKPVIVGIKKDLATKMIWTLPSGTFVTAKTPTSTNHYPRIK